MESHTVPSDATLRVDALETFVELLSRVESDPAGDAFYSRLCEATCRLAAMDRAVIFRYDSARRRVGAAGAYGIPLEVFADAQVTVETVPIARQCLEEDRVIEVSRDVAAIVPPEFHPLIERSTLVCTPMAAAGRWLGVILSDRGPDRPPLQDAERYALWTLGKMAGLAVLARVATNKQAQARQLQERMDLAREVHESVIQRLFGIQLVFSSQAELSREARERIGAELQAALFDLRRALQRPLGRSAPETHTTLLEEVERLRREHRDLGLVLRPGSERVQVPPELEPLAQSVLAEAVRNAHKHAAPSRVEVGLERKDGALVLDVVNDGVRGRAKQTGMGLRLAALEALQVGGIVEFGQREPGTWRVRLAVPLDRA
ncbi:GAF domain-containing sensor histidine kinase [Candidatus Solirubrobacter pratensis]|uniref:GAF domain-containing sensor histidine kinase n=1 Tax=Candidatus Solirubrobacter pratensis TaxID=1298857 RepID=UPI0004265AB6|nr:GAF domain-containing protein [Candidatus Solirubrobacter pratensis]